MKQSVCVASLQLKKKKKTTGQSLGIRHGWALVSQVAAPGEALCFRQQPARCPRAFGSGDAGSRVSLLPTEVCLPQQWHGLPQSGLSNASRCPRWSAFHLTSGVGQHTSELVVWTVFTLCGEKEALIANSPYHSKIAIYSKRIQRLQVFCYKHEKSCVLKRLFLSVL